MRIFLWLTVIHFSFVALAESKFPELFFPLENNHVQVLPQRFEYQLIDKDQIRIGDILMNANQIDFQLLSLNKQNSRFKLRFRWPAGFLQSGEIAIKDNSGKAIYLKAFDKSQLKITSGGDGEFGRTALATYETADDAELVLKEVQHYPFFKFCVHREEPLTKIYLCSKDLYLKKSQGGPAIMARDSFRPESFVEINGRSVGNQGIIFLNSPSEFVSMRTLMLSGATLELDTRMKSVEFKDVVLSPSGKEIIVRATGAEPVDPKLVKRRNAAEWEAHLEAERPYTYLKGEGDLPLRQEFLIQGAVRKENVKVQITSSSPERVYLDSLPLKLKATPGLTLAPSDTKSTLKKLSDDTYEWTLLDLNRNEKNRRFLKVDQESNQFLAAYDVERLTSFDVNSRLMIPFWLQLNALWIPSAKWGLDFQYDNQLSKDIEDPDLQLFLLGAQFRFPDGVHGRDSAYFAELYYQQLQSSIKILGLAGLALGAEIKTRGTLSSLAQWANVRIRVPLAGSDSDLQLKTSYDLELNLRRLAQQGFYFEAGVKYHSYLFESDSVRLKSEKTFALIGMGTNF